MIAQVNDLTGDANLVLGQPLTIPEVTTHANSASTFAPYDPSSIVGSTTPSLPTIAPPPPANSQHCNVLAEIIVVAVTVVVTYFTYGATSELLADELSGLGASVAASAAAGASGSVAGQLTGEAEGIQSGFNWGQSPRARWAAPSAERSRRVLPTPEPVPLPAVPHPMA